MGLTSSKKTQFVVQSGTSQSNKEHLKPTENCDSCCQLTVEKVHITITGMGNKSDSLRERKKEKTRETLIEVANRMFLETGFEKTTVDDIVDDHWFRVG